ncbi:MAG: hypothetical protein ACE5G2_02820, partial [Candidatus Krumholzibacteriia bacterium]
EARRAATPVLRATTEAEVAAASNRVLVLHAGRLVADGPPNAVFARLPEDVEQRVGLPLVWRLSKKLVRVGRMPRPTVSWQEVLTALGLSGPAPGGVA